MRVEEEEETSRLRHYLVEVESKHGRQDVLGGRGFRQEVC